MCTCSEYKKMHSCYRNVYLICCLLLNVYLINDCFCSTTFNMPAHFAYEPTSLISINNSIFLTQSVETNQKLVVLLDTSESMYTKNRIYKLQSAFHRWISTLPDGIVLGMIEFNNFAYPLVDLSPVNISSRDTFLRAIPKTARGGSCIGCAVRSAYQMLGGNTTNSLLLIITDGRNQIPGEAVTDIISWVGDTRMVVHTVALGTEADVNLEMLSWISGGKTYYTQDDEALIGLNNALFNTLEALLPDSFELVTVLETELPDTEYGMHVSSYVDVDNSPLTLDAYFGPKGTSLELEVKSKSSYTNTTINAIEDMWHFNRTLESGNFEVDIKFKAINKFAALFISTPLNATGPPPVTLKCWHNAEGGLVNTALEPIIIYAKVSKGNYPAINANVSALLLTPNGKRLFIELWDNGSGADLIIGDGIYSRYVLPVFQVGRYTMSVTANGKVGTTLEGLKNKNTGVNAFSRICRTTSFVVSSVPKHYAPAAISDLHIVDNNGTLSLVCWTATGNELDWGHPDYYVVKYFNMKKNRSYHTKNMVKNEDIAAHSISGNSECLEIDIRPFHSKDVSIFVSVAAVGKTGLIGNFSNVVEVYSPQEKVKLASTLRNEVQGEEISHLWLIIIITVLGINLIILGMLVLMRKLNILPDICRSHKRNRNPMLVSYTSLETTELKNEEGHV